MKTLSLQKQKALYLKARQAYYLDPDGATVMSDADFDALERSIAQQDPDWHVLKTTGHTKKTDVDLPNYMPSLSKIYKWPGRQSGAGYIWTPKLDGTSLQLVYVNGKPANLYTRGNGVTGGDVSFLLPFLDIPKKIPYKDTLHLRCEGVLTREKFNKRWKRKDGVDDPRKFASGRAAVNGQFNRTVDQCIPELLHDIDLVVVGVYNRRCGEMLKFAKAQGFKTAPELKFEHIDQDSLEAMLKWARKHVPCDIDGLVCCIRTRPFQYDDNEFPAWSHAFKQNEEGIQTTIRKIHWQISRFGRWTPVIEIEPVDYDGVTVTRASAHNAKWMYERRLGVGAVVKIVRSGEVIPYIDAVVKPAKTFSYPRGQYEWRGVHIHAVGEGAASDKAKVLQMTTFLRGIGVENIAAKSVQALVNQGYQSVPHIIKEVMDGAASGVVPPKITTALGKVLGRKFAKSLYGFCRAGIPLECVVVHSGAMDAGLGRTNTRKMAHAFPLVAVLKASPAELRSKIQSVHGLGPSVAKLVIAGQPSLIHMVKQLRAAGAKVIVPTEVLKAPRAKAGPYNGMVGAWTGYRDKEQERIFTDGGGIVGSLNSKTTHLFYNPSGKFMQKVENARAKGINVCTWKEFYK